MIVVMVIVMTVTMIKMPLVMLAIVMTTIVLTMQFKIMPSCFYDHNDNNSDSDT